MSSPEEVINYFSYKGQIWSQSGSLEQYVKKVGRKGIAEEFKNDPYFAVVCEYANQVGELQLRSDITNGVEDLVSIIFGVPFAGVLDVIIGAIEDACGKTFLAGKVMKSGIILLGIASLAYIFSGKKR
jgi:hypothetical protein